MLQSMNQLLGRRHIKKTSVLRSHGSILASLWILKRIKNCIFCCESFTHISVRSKLEARSIKSILLGYVEETEMGYRVLLP